ncbi:MAG: hypothetical protein H6R40_40, partial [Gemmatimonadetes bacterium]|nr:hypothetical protein [Gemmatimonadota bacterium]
MTQPNVPARIDRAALERILQRAAELQASEHEIGEGLTSDEVLALGKEVGIPGQYLQQAMLEDQGRIATPEAQGLAGYLAGPAEVAAARVVRGDQEAAERALIDWMEKNELLTVQRRQPGRISWERLGGLQAVLRGVSRLGSGRASFMLDRTDLVRATVTPLEPGFHHVSLTASLRASRSGYLGGGIAMASVGLASTMVLAALQAAWIAAAAPVAAGLLAGWALTRRYRPVADRTLLGLERALDYVEGAAIKPGHQVPARGSGLLDLLTGEVRR